MNNIYKTKIESLLLDLKYISFDYDDHSFLLNKKCNTKEGFINVSRLVEKLRWDNDFRFDIKNTPIKNMRFNYHDSCMQNYCYQIIDQGIPHYHTCWENVTSKRFHLGIMEEKEHFNNSFKENFINNLSINTNNKIINNLNYSIKRDLNSNKKALLENFTLSKDNWMTIQLINPISFSGFKENQIHKIKNIIRKITGYKLHERIIDISKSILNKKWDHNMGWECPNTVLGYSLKSNEYMTFTGRHRVNAAVYLFNKNIDIGIDCFTYPLIKYNWNKWLHAIEPKSNQLKNVKQYCNSCKKLK